MPVRIPGPRRSEVLTFGAAGVGVLTPLYFLFPGAQERLATQTARWAPRWERGIAHVTPRVERGVQRLSVPLGRTVRRIDERLPLERMAQGLAGGIRRGIKRVEDASKR